MGDRPRRGRLGQVGAGHRPMTTPPATGVARPRGQPERERRHDQAERAPHAPGEHEPGRRGVRRRHGHEGHHGDQPGEVAAEGDARPVDHRDEAEGVLGAEERVDDRQSQQGRPGVAAQRQAPDADDERARQRHGDGRVQQVGRGSVAGAPRVGRVNRQPRLTHHGPPGRKGQLVGEQGDTESPELLRHQLAGDDDRDDDVAEAGRGLVGHHQRPATAERPDPRAQHRQPAPPRWGGLTPAVAGARRHGRTRPAATWSWTHA